VVKWPVGISRDGSRVLTVGQLIDVPARLWWMDGRSGPVLYGRAVHGGAFDDSGDRLLTVSPDGTARIWTLGDPPGVRLFRGHRDGLESIDVSRDGTLLATASRDGTARVWPIDGGAPVVVGEVGGPIVKVATLSPDGTRLATSMPPAVEAVPGVGRIRVWPIAGGEPLAIPVPPDHLTRSLAFSVDGAWLASASLTRPEVLVSRSDGSGETVTLKGGGTYVAFSGDGTRLVSSGAGDRALVWRTDDWASEPVVIQASAAALGQAAFQPRGSLILTGSADKLQLFAQDGRELTALRRPGSYVIAWSSDGQLVATGMPDGSARISRLDLSTETIVLRGYWYSIGKALFSTHLEIIQLDPFGQPCQVTSSPHTGYTITDSVHHFLVDYGPLTIDISPTCGGSRRFQLRGVVTWLFGNTVKIDSGSSTNASLIVATTAPTTTVPPVTLWDQATAASRLQAAGLIVGTIARVVNLSPPGLVLAQNAPAGTVEPIGSAVNLTVSGGGVLVPNVEFLALAEATRTLRGLGLSADISYSNACIEPGHVINQAPSAGAVVPPGATVRITVDSAPRTCLDK
jgi:WD40 repeat protein